MTSDLLFAVSSAGWLGILTSISPCPLATNIAAISFIGRRVGSPRAVVATGFLYAVGRSLVYIVLASALVASLVSAPAVSHLLQRYMNKLLGPILILVGLVLLELIQIGGVESGLGEKLGRRVETWGAWGGLALGAVFALSFCPASAALFFGGLLPLAVKYDSSLLLPTFFGAATALPVLLFGVLIGVGTGAVGRAFDRLSQFEWWARRVTGVAFIGIGLHFSLTYIFRVL